MIELLTRKTVSSSRRRLNVKEYREERAKSKAEKGILLGGIDSVREVTSDGVGVVMLERGEEGKESRRED